MCTFFQLVCFFLLNLDFLANDIKPNEPAFAAKSPLLVAHSSTCCTKNHGKNTFQNAMGAYFVVYTKSVSPQPKNDWTDAKRKEISCYILTLHFTTTTPLQGVWNVNCYFIKTLSLKYLWMKAGCTWHFMLDSEHTSSQDCRKKQKIQSVYGSLSIVYWTIC